MTDEFEERRLKHEAWKAAELRYHAIVERKCRGEDVEKALAAAITEMARAKEEYETAAADVENRPNR